MTKHIIKRITPQPLWKVISNSYWWWFNRGRHVLSKSFNPRWKKNLIRLQSFQGKHSGKRCFIIGNGPSLRDTDLSLLQNEITFGLNRIYLLFPELGFSTTYLVSINDLVLEQFSQDLKNLDLPKFFTWRARRWFPDDPTFLFLDTDYTGDETFTGMISKRFFEGYTVTYVALQLAFAMGISEAILIGVDHSFQTKGSPNVTVTSHGDDPNHFAPNYFGAGVKWQLPDLDGSEKAYTMARNAYEQGGRRILDATIGGKLTIYPKVNYYDLFK